MANIYITDDETQQIFTISNHYYDGNLYQYQISHENAETILYSIG